MSQRRGSGIVSGNLVAIDARHGRFDGRMDLAAGRPWPGKFWPKTDNSMATVRRLADRN